MFITSVNVRVTNAARTSCHRMVNISSLTFCDKNSSESRLDKLLVPDSDVLVDTKFSSPESGSPYYNLVTAGGKLTVNMQR